MKISLMVLCAGKAAGKALPINAAQFIIGRDPQCCLRPASTMISKKHCAVLVKGGQVLLRDFDSTNGTFVNDEQIKGEVPLKDGDVLRLGPLSFKLVIEGMPAPSKPPSRPEGIKISDEDGVSASNVVNMSETAQDHVLGSTTTTDMPTFAPPEGIPAEPGAEKNDEEPEEQKLVGKAPVKPGVTQDAANAVLERMRAGRRK
jgi:predicted component of type VI protein secretion system